MDQVVLHMRNTYQFHVYTLSASPNIRNDQPDGDGDGDGDGDVDGDGDGGGAHDQCSNVVLQPDETIQPPQNARTARTNRRDAQSRPATTVGPGAGDGGNNGDDNRNHDDRGQNNSGVYGDGAGDGDGDDGCRRSSRSFPINQHGSPTYFSLSTSSDHSSYYIFE